jgi:hypothetical protein
MVKILEEHSSEYGAGTFENTPYPELEKFAEMIIEDCIRTLHSNGYDDAAKCLQDIHFGIENPV